MFHIILLLLLNNISMYDICTKRIQPACGWCATVGGTLQVVPIPSTHFLGEASHATPQHGWRSACSLRETESNPGPKPTLKSLLHTRTKPPTLTKYTNSSVQPPQSSPPSLYQAHSPPKSPTSVQPPKSHPLHHPAHSLSTLLT